MCLRKSVVRGMKVSRAVRFSFLTSKNVLCTYFCTGPLSRFCFVKSFDHWWNRLISQLRPFTMIGPTAFPSKIGSDSHWPLLPFCFYKNTVGFWVREALGGVMSFFGSKSLKNRPDLALCTVFAYSLQESFSTVGATVTSVVHYGWHAPRFSVPRSVEKISRRDCWDSQHSYWSVLYLN